MHVLIIPSEEFLPPTSHLAGIFQLHQARALASAGHRVGLLSVRLVYSVPMLLKGALTRLIGGAGSPMLPKGSAGSLLSLLWRKIFRGSGFISCEQTAGFPVVRVEGIYWLWPSPRFDHQGWLAAGRAAFAEYVERHGRPDVIHAHNALYAGLLAQSVSRVSGIPYVVTEHSSYLTRKLYPLRVMRRAARCFSDAAGFAVVSKWLGRQLEEIMGTEASRWRWIPNVVDPELESLPISRRVAEPFTFLTIGDLIPIKDQHTLLRGFAEGGAALADCHLRIAGDGAEEGPLRALATELGVSDRVEFLGRISRDRVAQELDHCHCFVLTSRMETFGVVLIEALSRGRPVITTECGGPQDVIGESNGRLVPVGGIHELAEAMVWMRGHDDGFDPDELREDVAKRFGPDALVRNLNECYRTAVKGTIEHV